MKIRNTFIIFIVSGFWHGANWTFVFWGALNAFYFLPLLLTKNNRNNLEIVAQGHYLPTLKDLFLILMTFSLTVFAWIFFRADNMGHAIGIISEILSPTLLTIPSIKPTNVILLICFLIFIEWLGREGKHALSHIFVIRKRILRWSFYIFLCILIILYKGKEQEFIYFQF